MVTVQASPTSQLPIPDWFQLIRAEYLEIPDLHLTRRQVERFWGLNTLACDALLDSFLATGFLRQTATGAYVRATA
jgi:hypothetical protein